MPAPKRVPLTPKSNRNGPTSKYSALWREEKSSFSNVRGYDNVELSTVCTWGDDPRHEDHLDTVRSFLLFKTKGFDMKTGKEREYQPPCGDGINKGYIEYVFNDHRAELSCALTVWARVNDKEPFVVNSIVCKDLDRMTGIEQRLYIWMVCGGFPGAFSLAMATLKKEARLRMDGSETKYKGLCLTASKLSLIEVYERQGFELTPNACTYPTSSRPRTRRGMEAVRGLYTDRVEDFICNSEDDRIKCEETDAATWASALVSIGFEHPRPVFSDPSLGGNFKLLSPEQKKQRKKEEEAFWLEQKQKVGNKKWPMEDATDLAAPGDGIFMDFCFDRNPV